MITTLGAIETVLFDKDGTLLDFHRTWDQIVVTALRQVSGRDVDALQAAALAIGVDLRSGTIMPDAAFVSESNAQIAERLRPHLDPDHFEQSLLAMSQGVATPAAGVVDLLDHLSSAKIPLGVVTNDSAAHARTQLDELGWLPLFGSVIGYDSGYSAKPSAGPVLAAIHELGGEPKTTLMIGDAAPDILSGRDAGALTAYLGTSEALIALADLSADTVDQLAEKLFAPTPG